MHAHMKTPAFSLTGLILMLFPVLSLAQDGYISPSGNLIVGGPDGSLRRCIPKTDNAQMI
jgi:hypothetical protein